MVTVVAGVWLIFWTFLLTIGWSFSIRQNVIHYKMGDKLTAFRNCCEKPGNNFQSWFKNEYVPSIVLKQKKKVENRKFLVFQPSKSLSFEKQINGLLSSFALAMASERELLVDWSEEMNNIFKSPGWVWKYSILFPKKRWFGHITFDLVTPPSFIVPPAHKWRWSDLLQSSIGKKMFGKEKVVMVNVDEFIAPLLWVNPVYREKMCKLSNIDQIYYNFASVLLNFSDQVLKVSEKLEKEVGETAIIAVINSKLPAINKFKKMTDTALRCMDAIDNNEKNWLIVKQGRTFSSIIKWKKVGVHRISFFDDLECLKNVKKELRMAALLHYANKAQAVVGFTGSKLAESAAFGVNKSLYMVLHRVPFCSKVAIRLPCIEKWPNIINSVGIDMDRFMVSEMNNFMHCQA